MSIIQPSSNILTSNITGTTNKWYFPTTTTCSVVVAGGGGNNSTGGCGEIVAGTYTFNPGIYTLNVGDTGTPSSIVGSDGSTTLIQANTGGNGGTLITPTVFALTTGATIPDLNNISGTNQFYYVFKAYSQYNTTATTATVTSYTITFANPTTINLLMVGGGGGGGCSLGSGGGGGGVIYATSYLLPADTYTINVGSGGWGMQNGNDLTTINGTNTTFVNSSGTTLFTAYGGGRGNGQSSAYDNGLESFSGGSGGGGVRNRNQGGAAIQPFNTPSGAIGYGNPGGNGNSSAPSYGGAGGGGAGSAGGNGTANSAGNGGNAIGINITGTVNYYAAGGGGGCSGGISVGGQGASGVYLGGGGTDYFVQGNLTGNGVNDTGSGGGGGGLTIGGYGSAGICIISFNNSQVFPVSVAGGSIIPISNNNYYASFTSTTTNNSITFNQGTYCDVLIVGGGGCGGGDTGGGGGGGGVIYQKNVYVPTGTYNITVGAGGTVSNALRYPPTTFTSITYNSSTLQTATISGQAYGNGTYIIKSSSCYSSSAWYASYMFETNFTDNGYQCWHTLDGNISSTQYTGSFSTTINGVSYPGEWAQIQLPNPIIIASYQLIDRGGGDTYTRRMPSIFLLLGSNDGINWVIVDSQNLTTGYITKAFIVQSYTTAYSYYRLSISRIFSSDLQYVNIGEWVIYASTNNGGNSSVFGAIAYGGGGGYMALDF